MKGGDQVQHHPHKAFFFFNFPFVRDLTGGDGRKTCNVYCFLEERKRFKIVCGIRSLKRWVGLGDWRSVSGITDARTPWLAFSSRWRYAGGVLLRRDDRIRCLVATYTSYARSAESTSGGQVVRPSPLHSSGKGTVIDRHLRFPRF